MRNLIEFDETEYLNQAVSDKTLYLVLLFCGSEARDKLLYGGGNNVDNLGYPLRPDLLRTS